VNLLTVISKGVS